MRGFLVLSQALRWALAGMMLSMLAVIALVLCAGFLPLLPALPQHRAK